MSNNIVSISAHRDAAKALEQYFPERALKLKQRAGSADQVRSDLHLEPRELTLDLLEHPRKANAAAASPELWPVVAAGFVAIGVSIVALAAVAKLGYF